MAMDYSGHFEIQSRANRGLRVGNQSSRRVSEKIGLWLFDQIELNGTSGWKYGIDNQLKIEDIKFGDCL